MGIKISDIVTLNASPTNDDRFEISRKISSAPDVWDTQYITWSDLSALIGGIPTLNDVLTNGPDTAGEDIILTNADVIKSSTPSKSQIWFGAAGDEINLDNAGGGGGQFFLHGSDGLVILQNADGALTWNASDITLTHGVEINLSTPIINTAGIIVKDSSVTTAALSVVDDAMTVGAGDVEDLDSASRIASTSYQTSSSGNEAILVELATNGTQTVTTEHKVTGGVATLKVFSNYASFAGIQEVSDYSANYTDLSYMNKGSITALIQSYVAGLMDYRGVYDASVNAYPSSGGSGTAGAILKSDFWIVSVAGTLPTGIVVNAGDLIIAKVDTPGNTQANWSTVEYNIGYTPENAANKNNTALSTSTTEYPTLNLVKTVTDLLAPLASPVLTGTPEAPTQPFGTDDESIATTEFVQEKLLSKTFTTNATTTSNSAGPLSNFSFTGVANGVYVIDIFMRTNCNNTGGIKYSITLPGTTTMGVALFGNSTSSTAFSVEAMSASATLSSAFNTYNGSGEMRMRGKIVMDGTGGVVTVNFASGVNLQTSLIGASTSSMIVYRDA